MKVSRQRFYEILVGEAASVLTEQPQPTEAPPVSPFTAAAAAAGGREPFNLSNLEPARKENIFQRMSDRLARWANRKIAPAGTTEEDLEKAFLMMFKNMTEDEAETAIKNMI